MSLILTDETKYMKGDAGFNPRYFYGDTKI